ncbi:MAG: iron chelate uptake ABC transporter family permease subunit [candidate division Zixibacteria bacterium]|nr:iron chelate uptake ABC transporter family permease subunit [candidate division Zixibacteria bacterium]
MELFGFLGEIITDYTLRTVALGSAILGIISGALGSFAVLRKQSLLGDAISHAALPGIAFAFILTGIKSPIILIIGAAVAGWFGTLLMLSVIKNTRIKTDGALGLILSTFFGFGLVLLTYIQKQPQANQAGLDKFLFGQASTLLQSDVIIMGILGAIALVILMLFWKEFKILTFDPDFGESIGLPIRLLDILITFLLVIAIVIGLQTVGVVLMSAMVVAPAAAARQWTNHLGLMVVLAGIFGIIAGVSGAIISSVGAKLPTGPIIVLCISLIVGISMLFAPNRGLVWNWIRRRINRHRLHLEAVLSDLYELTLHHERRDHPHSVRALETMSIGGGEFVRNSLRELQTKGWVKNVSGDEWALTESGLAKANDLVKERQV